MRSEVDLGHIVQTVSDIGRLQCIGRMPVIAGDSFDIKIKALFRLNQLRRPLAVDIKTDVFVFYCPYRYTYGQQWVNFIEKGPDEVETFPTVTGPFPCLLADATTVPQHIVADYLNIYNYHFRDPSLAELVQADMLGTAATALARRKYGLTVCHLKSWGTAQAGLANLTSSAFDVPAGSIDLFDLQRQKALGRSRLSRQFVSSRYAEIMGDLSGGDLPDYADNIPELVWQESQWMSGYDINATAGAEIGSSVGKGVGQVGLNLPRRWFPEHGTLYFFSVLRIPPVFQDAIQYLDNFNRPWADIIPEDGSDHPPRDLLMSEVWVGGGATSLGAIPAYEWYRDHPSYLHPDFSDVDTGWQFLPRPTTRETALLCGNYDAMFSSLKLRHAVAVVENLTTALRPISSPFSSVYGSME